MSSWAFHNKQTITIKLIRAEEFVPAQLKVPIDRCWNEPQNPGMSFALEVPSSWLFSEKCFKYVGKYCFHNLLRIDETKHGHTRPPSLPRCTRRYSCSPGVVLYNLPISINTLTLKLCLFVKNIFLNKTHRCHDRLFAAEFYFCNYPKSLFVKETCVIQNKCTN